MAKSDLHIELLRRALVWLETKATGRGINAAEEVIVRDGYTVDGMAICGLQMSIERQFTGNNRNSWEHSGDHVFLFESKVSRADFFNTFKRGNHKGDRLTPEGNFHFVVTPKGMVTPEEVPAFGIIGAERGRHKIKQAAGISANNRFLLNT